MGLSVFDFGELFTLCARPVIGAAARRGLSFHFDFPAGPSRIEGHAQAFQRSIHRMLSAASRTLDGGALMLAADVSGSPRRGHVDLHIHAAATGQTCPDAVLDRLLRELLLVRDDGGADGTRVVSARGKCPILGADLHFRADPHAGILLDFSMCQPGTVADDVALPNARGAVALVLHGPGAPVQGLKRRLERLGWEVGLHDHEAGLRQALTHDDGTCRLVVVVESPQLNLAELVRLDTVLPLPLPRSHCPCVFSVGVGSPAVGAALPTGWTLLPRPFLPSELWEFTRRADPDADERHERSRPTPLPASTRPRVLVVDDDEVNRVIASGLLQMVGYEAWSAASGDEAIAMCQQNAPDAVLMDINMPGRDGYETTAALRGLQQRGGIPPFPIIAATAAGTPARSAERGLDGHLTKPLMVDELRTQLTRALSGLATGL